MEQNLRELLLRDLCARVPYHPKGHVVNACNGSMCDEWLTCATFTMFTNIMNNCRLYLRPMSSMTEKECVELSQIRPFDDEVEAWKYIKTPVPLKIANIKHFDFFHSHHLDWRGLIERGLALEAPEGMYNLEKK